MADEFSRVHAKRRLAGEGFTVEDIPQVSGERRADLRARWLDEEYLVEAKGKGETTNWRTFLSEVRERGLATTAREIKQWNTVSAVIRDAHDQLVATPASDSAFRILWLVAAHADSSFVLSSVEKRLFGLENLVAIKSTRSLPETKLCYYYSHSDFVRLPDLDAAVLSTQEAGFMCVNSFSPRRCSLRTSRLYEILNRGGAIRDPEISEQRGDAFLIDGNIDRTSGKAQWNFLREKYGYGTSVMIDSQFNALVTVSVDDLEDGR